MRCRCVLKKGTHAVGCVDNEGSSWCFLSCYRCAEEVCGHDVRVRLAMGAAEADGEAVMGDG